MCRFAAGDLLTYPVPEKGFDYSLAIGFFDYQKDPEAAMRALAFTATGLWGADGEPDVTRVLQLARRLRAGFVFVTRLAEASLRQEEADGAARKRATAEVDGRLIRVSDGEVIWRDRATGGSAARTEYVRNEARIRSDEQCLSDAARTAYAHLRFAFDVFRRRFEQ